MTFVKGQVNNPGGRPKAFYAIAKLIHAKTNDGEKLVERVLKIAWGEDAKLDDAKSIRWALDWLTNRGFGKVAAFIDSTKGDDGPVIDWSKLDDATLRALAKADEAVKARPAKVLQLVPPDPGPVPKGDDGRGDG